MGHPKKSICICITVLYRAAQLYAITVYILEQKRKKGAMLMAKARWNGATLAESDDCLVVEGNYYFPPDSVHREYLKESKVHSLCFWKGLASYYDIVVGSKRNKNAAWYYPHPSPLARRITRYGLPAAPDIWGPRVTRTVRGRMLPLRQRRH